MGLRFYIALLGPAAKGVDVVPQKSPDGAHDQHVDNVEADLDVTVGAVACEPGRCRLAGGLITTTPC